MLLEKQRNGEKQKPGAYDTKAKRLVSKPMRLKVLRTYRPGTFVISYKQRIPKL